MESVKYCWNHRPLSLILLLAFLVRIFSVLFSKGYGMHDDHFLIIEAAQSWVDGYDYNDWLPKNRPDAQPTGHSWFYVGLHYYFFKFLESIGVVEAQFKLYFVRLLHALWYLLAIRFAFKITLKIDGLQSARMVGLFMALLWFTPIMSVRNLVEVVCLTPLLGATYLLIKDEALPIRNVLFAGLLVGVAVAVRFQTILFLGGMGLVLMTRNVFKASLLGISFLLSLFVSQIGDLFLWGRPFAEFSEYVAYNFANKTTYFSRPWYMYLGTLTGLLLPPFSLFLLTGWIKMVKRQYVLITVPALVFFGFHCYFPNKQERFIIPFIPYFILIGWVGWNKVVALSTWNLKKLQNYGMRFFWVLNCMLLVAITPAYTKKSRVETMEFLGGQTNYNGLIVEYTTEYEAPLMPRYYAKSWKPVNSITKADQLEERITYLFNDQVERRANHIVFFEPDDLIERKQRVERIGKCKLVEIAVVEPSYLDRFVHWLNPVNENEQAFIYQINYLI